MIKKLKEIRPGEIFKFAGYEWIKLEQEGLCLMKDILEKRRFDEYSNNWEKSELKAYLNNCFLNKLQNNGANIAEDLKIITTDLTADDGMKGYGKNTAAISLITSELYRTNRHLLEPIDDWWWTATSFSCMPRYMNFERIVTALGTQTSIFAYYEHGGVRPLICLSPEAHVEMFGGERSSDNAEIKELANLWKEEKEVTELIKKWATDRNLDKADPKAQMVKLMEEVGELANGINKDKKEQTIDSIGDIYVVLVILCMQLGLDIKDCTKAAYDEIKDRKGKMVNGLFVKEGDL